MFKWIALLVLPFASICSLAQVTSSFAGLIYSPGEERVQNTLIYPQTGSRALMWNVQSRAIHIPSWFVHSASVGFRNEFNAASIHWNISGKDEWGVQAGSLTYGRKIHRTTTLGMGSHMEWLRGNLKTEYRLGFDFYTHFSVGKIKGTLLLQNALAYSSTLQNEDRNTATGIWVNYAFNDHHTLGFKWLNDNASTFALEYIASISIGEIFVITSTQQNLILGYTLKTSHIDLVLCAGVGRPFTGLTGLGHATAL